jgi:uncharacterized membrane protein
MGVLIGMVVVVMLTVFFFYAIIQITEGKPILPKRKAKPIHVLQHQLAEGKITEEEFWERESVLRATTPRKRGLLR